MDSFSKKKRSEVMSMIRSKNTNPEIKVRSFLHRLGYRFRLHDSALPGKPDIVLKKFKTVIFVNGCFWHQHPTCRLAKIPKINIKFWRNKLKNNILRQAKNIKALRKMGFKVIIVWECQVYRNLEKAMSIVGKKLNKQLLE